MTTMPKILVVVHDIDDNLNEMANPIAEAGILMDTWDVQNDSVGRPDLEKLEQQSDGASAETIAQLQATQIRLATEQARYEITFRQDLAEIADQLRRPR